MPEFPTGTVTFLFTDIEGSTALLQEHGDDYADVLAEHRRVLRHAFAVHGGVEVDTQGDAFFYAFTRASDAIAAAEQAQGTLELPVRIGIHTGEPLVTDEGYLGIDVHRAARICSAAHGGQVLLSEQTERLLGDTSSTALLDLGEHRLKDLGEPVRLYQLGRGAFSPLRTLDRTNLPPQPTPLVGRERELQELLKLVRAARLVTLTGPGGSGKTRLALQAAAELVDDFPDGVFFVALAPVERHELVVSTVAKTLGLQEAEDESIEETLERYLLYKRLLLVLDNFEHLLDAGGNVARILVAAPSITAMVTSRAALHLAGEHEHAVDGLSSEDAVALFADRARHVRTGFELSEENADTVSEICTRLDGLPLAIELAAARTKLLPPGALLARLEQRLPLLAGGPRDAPARQQTLRATVDWSYDMLDGAEQAVFRRLGAFSGGCTIEAAEEVCHAGLGDLESLMDKSLLRNAESGSGDARVSMLLTIHEYASERLGEACESDEVCRVHAEYYCALAERSEPEILRAHQAEWLDRLQDDIDNFRSALEWSLEHDPELALRLIAALRRAWVARGHLSETRGWLERTLTRCEGATLARAKALYGLGRVALSQGDYGFAVDRLEESAALSRELGDREFTVYSLADLAWIATDREEMDRAARLAEQSLREARASRDATLTAAAVHSVATIALHTRDYDRARALYQESIDLRRSLGDWRNVANSLEGLALVEILAGDYDSAQETLDEALSLGRNLGNQLIVSAGISNLALAALFRGDEGQAEELAVESLVLSSELGDRRTITQSLHILAAVAATKGDLGRSAILSGAADGLHGATGSRPWVAERVIEERFLQPVRARRPEFEQLIARGRALTLDDAVSLALGPQAVKS